MTLLVRKITRGKWPSNNLGSYNINQLDADTLTSELRTKENTLSTWAITDMSKLEEAALALVSGQDKMETMDLVILDFATVSGKLSVSPTKGVSPVKDLEDTHKDICNLSYGSLGEFASLIVDAIENDNYKRYSRKELIQIVEKAINNGRLDPMNVMVKDKLREDIRKSIGLNANAS